MDICSSPRLFAAYHVLHRLSVPRHSPDALIRLTLAECSSDTTFLSCFTLIHIYQSFLLFSIFYEFQINDIWKNRKSRAFWEKAKMDFFKFVKFSENKKISLERCLWETGKNEAYNERKYYFFYKRSNIKVKLNRDRSAVMQSYRYKCSQIRCRETEVLPLPLSCRIY